MQTDWLQILDEYWDEKDTPYSRDFYFWPDWLYQYSNELPLHKAIESAYLTCKSWKHRRTPKYDILHSLVQLVKHYFVTMEEDDTLLKMTGKQRNGFAAC